MKIAVLFTSANPLTLAHVAILKTAIQTLGAEKGLFVATSGKYLKRKILKIGDPFYLTEEERESIITSVCAKEPCLSFWGFEMGGASPKRYKTLEKIQKQYPEAELWEVQGADKLRSIPKMADAEEYLSHIRFAVFGRGNIAMREVLEKVPLLSLYQERFTLLPALERGAEISSTEVRRRFRTGEDLGGLLPQGAVEVLSRHTLEEFQMSFEERMALLMKRGRFGLQAAQKEVYAENLKLFHCWKAGTSPFALGDYKTFLQNTKLYRAPFDVTAMGNTYPHTQTGCINMDCVDLAEQLLSLGYNPAILNLASAKKPGGGYRDGMSAQEECLCRSSTLSLSLYQFGDPKYVNVRESGVEIKEIGYPLHLRYGGIYTPGVTFFRHGKGKNFTLRKTPFSCDVITVAALSFNGRMNYAYANEMSYRGEDGGFTPEGEEIMLQKIRTVFRLAVEQGKDSLVLGAFGCGAYKLPPDEVARLFGIVMEEKEFCQKFRLLVFAILESNSAPEGAAGKFAPFYQTFGTFSFEA